jgi:hypothetical protein
MPYAGNNWAVLLTMQWLSLKLVCMSVFPGRSPRLDPPPPGLIRFSGAHCMQLRPQRANIAFLVAVVAVLLLLLLLLSSPNMATL